MVSGEASVNSKDKSDINNNPARILDDMPSFSEFRAQQEVMGAEHNVANGSMEEENISDNGSTERIRESYEKKYNDYSEQLKELFGVQSLDECDLGIFIWNKTKDNRIDELIKDTFQSFDEDELSLLRSEFISQSPLFDGKGTGNNGSFLALKELNELDSNFFDSKEYQEYIERVRREEFQKKYNSYTKQIRDFLDAQSLTSEEYHDSLFELWQNQDNGIKEITQRTVQDFNDSDYDILRSEFIKRSDAFNGEENPRESGSDFVELICLMNADKDFLQSKEYFDYLFGEQQTEPELIKKQLQEMDSKSIDALRNMRYRYELTGDDPVQCLDEKGSEDFRKKTENERIRGLWKYDEGWDDSDQERQMRRWLEDNIFSPDLQQIEYCVGTMLHSMDIDKAKDFFNKNNIRDGVEEAIAFLSKQFGIQMPGIVFEIRDPEDKQKGFYSYKDKSITFRYDGDYNDKMSADAINTIAHEMWHAYQAHLAKNSSLEINGRGLLYKANFRNYAESDTEGYYRYRNQLVEDEAWLFGDAFTELVTNSNEADIAEES